MNTNSTNRTFNCILLLLSQVFGKYIPKFEGFGIQLAAIGTQFTLMMSSIDWVSCASLVIDM